MEVARHQTCDISYAINACKTHATNQLILCNDEASDMLWCNNAKKGGMIKKVGC